MQMSLNVRHLLIVSLGYNDFIQEEIDKVYDKNRWVYYETFKNSGFYDDMVIKSFTSSKEDKMRKVAGIVEWCYDNNDFRNIRNLINKGYRNVVRYYESNKTKLDLETFTNYIVKRNNNELYNYSELDLSLHHVILVYLAHLDGLNIKSLFGTHYGEIALLALQSLFVDIAQDIIVKDYIQKNDNIRTEAKQYIKDTLGFDVDKKYPEVIGNMFDYTIDQTVNEKLNAVGKTIKRRSGEDVKRIRSNLFTEGIFKYMGSFSSTLKLSGLNYGDLLNTPISKDDLILYAHNAIDRKRGNKMDDREMEQFFIGSLVIHALFSQYKKQKNTLISDATESWYVDVMNREQQLKDSVLFYEKTKKNMESQLAEENKKREELEAKILQLEKELERSNNEVESFQGDKEELIELRNFAYHQHKIDFVTSENTIEEAKENLGEKKIIICGGHPNMVQKLKEWIPNLETMSTDTLGKNFSHLSGYDAVYFYPNYANHSFYKKIKDAVATSKTPFIYLPDIDNRERLVMEMYHNII